MSLSIGQKIREFIVEDIGYQLSPCLYNRSHALLFEFIRAKTPKEFLGREIYDLGCGDGENTVRIQNVFQAKNIIACDRSAPMLKRAKQKGFSLKKMDFNDEFPNGEMATFTYALHHAYDKEKVLQKALDKFKYLFICEPYLNIFHFFNWGHVPTRKQWIKLFDKILKDYKLFEYKNNLIVFYKNKRS